MNLPKASFLGLTTFWVTLTSVAAQAEIKRLVVESVTNHENGATIAGFEWTCQPSTSGAPTGEAVEALVFQDQTGFPANISEKVYNACNKQALIAVGNPKLFLEFDKENSTSGGFPRIKSCTLKVDVCP